MADPELYRHREEVDTWKLRDPVRHFQTSLQLGGFITDEQIRRQRTRSSGWWRRRSGLPRRAPSPTPARSVKMYTRTTSSSSTSDRTPVAAGRIAVANITYREALRQAMAEEMREDDRVFIMGEDVAAYGGTYAVTKGMVDEFGDKRLRDTPIAESVIVGAAVGAAMAGLRPIAELMTVNFSLLAMDQIVNHAAKMHFMFGGQMSCPMVIRTAAGWGQLGPTHSQTFENYFAYVPGLIVVAPSTPRDAKGLLKAAIRDPNPVIFLEHSLLYSIKGEVPENGHVEPLGKSQLLRQW